MLTTTSDLLAVAAACLAINAGFLGILLPLHYSLIASLLQGVPEHASDTHSSDIRGFCATADTLVNLAACVWLANVVIGICLLGEYTTTSAAFFSTMGTVSAFAFPILASRVICNSYAANGQRDINAFCIPSGNSSKWRAIAGLLFTIVGLMIAPIVSGLLMFARVGQPVAYHWRPADLATAFLVGTFLSAIMVLAWILAGLYFRPFDALQKLKRVLTSSTSATTSTPL